MLKHHSDVSLRALNTLAIDASARELFVFDDPADADELCRQLHGKQAPLIIGAGSNLVLADSIEAPVVAMRLRGRRIVSKDARSTVVEAAGGEDWDSFVQWTLGHGLGGLENLALIPGTVGAAPVQNIGAYGVELSERFESLDALDLRSRRTVEIDAAGCGFGYRNSVFRGDRAPTLLITAVRFRLEHDAALVLEYGDVRAELGAGGVDPNNAGHAQVAEAIRRIRRRKLPDPKQVGNAGSYFKNPVVDSLTASRLARAFPGMPMHRHTSGAHNEFKLSAGWLIEQSGWKGFRDGDAGVHIAHALVLVNHGFASGTQIVALGTRIADSVRARFGVDLEVEPRIVQGL